MKDPGKLTDQPDITEKELKQVFIQNTGPDFTRESTERVGKIPNSTYENSDLDKVATAEVQLNKNKHKKLLTILT